MRRPALLSFPAVAAALTLAACGGSSYSAGSSTPTTASQTTAASSSAAPVKPAANATLGETILTNAAGMTLYRLSGERAGHFICTAGCLQIWHPLTASASATGAGAVPSLGVVKRPQGSSQLAYKGMPLYTFAQDTRPGDARGQGLKDVGTWNAVTAGGASSASPAASTTSEPSAPSSSGGYRY